MTRVLEEEEEVGEEEEVEEEEEISIVVYSKILEITPVPIVICPSRIVTRIPS